MEKQSQQRRLIALTLTSLAALILVGLGVYELGFKEKGEPDLIAQETQDIQPDSTASFPIPEPHELLAFASASQEIKIESEPTPVQEEPKPAAAQPPKQIAVRKHTVVKGDTLSTLSVQYYGTSRRWKEIYEANISKIPDQNRIKVGTELTIP